jgi:two-component system, OmpR family, response regulator protein BraR/BceR
MHGDGCMIDGGAMRILIVEDDPVISGRVKQTLEKWGYEARSVEDFSSVLSEVQAFEPHLVLLDIMLPGYNGFYWCEKIRQFSKTPIVFISSAADNMNIVMAMNMGGDDFIMKPFDINVLLAKISAILRRTYSYQGQINVIERDGVVLNLGDASVIHGGRRVELTRNEVKILQLLMENQGNIVSRDNIMERLWQSDEFIDDNTLTVNVNRLRKRLLEIGRMDFIKTKKGIGYYVD